MGSSLTTASGKQYVGKSSLCGFLISRYLFELEFFERVLLVLYKKLDTARGAAEKASFIRPALCLLFGTLVFTKL